MYLLTVTILPFRALIIGFLFIATLLVANIFWIGHGSKSQVKPICDFRRYYIVHYMLPLGGLSCRSYVCLLDLSSLLGDSIGLKSKEYVRHVKKRLLWLLHLIHPSLMLLLLWFLACHPLLGKRSQRNLLLVDLSGCSNPFWLTEKIPIPGRKQFKSLFVVQNQKRIGLRLLFSRKALAPIEAVLQRSNQVIIPTFIITNVPNLQVCLAHAIISTAYVYHIYWLSS